MNIHAHNNWCDVFTLTGKKHLINWVKFTKCTSYSSGKSNLLVQVRKRHVMSSAIVKYAIAIYEFYNYIASAQGSRTAIFSLHRSFGFRVGTRNSVMDLSSTESGLKSPLWFYPSGWTGNPRGSTSRSSTWLPFDHTILFVHSISVYLNESKGATNKQNKK